MPFNSFLITAMGRSGTKFLSQAMNRSKMWTVKHEPNGPQDYILDSRNIQLIQTRFNRNYYGEVNSYLRFLIDKIKCEKKGIILRNPVDLWFSITTWHSRRKWTGDIKNKWNQDFKDIMKTVSLLLKMINTGKYFIISFEKMIKELKYLETIFEYFGINDVNINNKMLDKKINASIGIPRTTWKDFRPGIKEGILKINDDYLRSMRIRNVL